MNEYESLKHDEFLADGEYWDTIELPWKDEDEDLNIESLLISRNDF